MNTMYELNMSNTRYDMHTDKIQKTSPVVEVFSALAHGKRPNVDAKVLDKSVNYLKETAGKAMTGDPTAISEINTIVRFSIEPKLLEAIKLFDFMGTYHQIGYNEAAYMKTYRYESIDARFQASSSDVTFPAVSWTEYPISTQTISAGLAVDYREIQSGNFDGTIGEAMDQVQIDMRNKCVYYVMTVLYDAVKNASPVNHFVESAGITQDAVDDMLKIMRRYGKVNIAGDYSVVSQLNDFSGYYVLTANAIPFGADAVAEEIRRTGLITMYKGAYVTELPNAINWTKLDSSGSEYALYMPQGLLFFIPRGAVSPLQVFLRGGLTTMTGDDIVTRQHLTRFDMEIGAGVAKGMEDQIGVISDTNYEAPSIS